jgi:hypothetical protein
LQKRPDLSQQGSPGMDTRVATVARWEVEMKEGEITKGEELSVARRRRGNLDRHRERTAIVLLGLEREVERKVE